MSQIPPNQSSEPTLASGTFRDRYPAEAQKRIRHAFEWRREPSKFPYFISGDAHAFLASQNDEKWARKHTQRDINQVLINRSIYACQIVGYEKDGRKMIHLNFFPKNEMTTRKPGTTEPYWHFRYVVVCDGGPSFWQIDYDCQTKRFLNFMANGQG